jgi:hypothetical protein
VFYRMICGMKGPKKPFILLEAVLYCIMNARNASQITEKLYCFL